MRTPARAFYRLLLILCLGALGSLTANAQVTISPTTVNFGSIYLGLSSSTQTVTLTNTGTSTVSVTALTVSAPFHLMAGQYLVNTNIKAGQKATYSFFFAPTAAQSYNSTITFTVSKNKYSATLEGTGKTTTAVASLSTTSINFGNVAVGSASTQNVTVTNTGTSEVTIESISTEPPFSIGGFTKSEELQPEQTFTFQVTFNATLVTSGFIPPPFTTGNVTLAYDVVPSNGISLCAGGVAATKLAVMNYPTLPSAIQGDTYLSTLLATGGTAPFQWRVTTGSLPSGLTLGSSGSTAGEMTGTVGSTVATGNYTVTVQTKDSSSPTKQNATTSITVPVAAPTGAACNNISVDESGTNNPLVPITDLGTGTYEGYEGGLYGGGSNVDPSAHLSSGESIAAGIQPRDANGTVDTTNGSIVLLGIGVSVSEEGFDYFVTYANADPAKNPKVVPIDGAEGGEDASQLATSTNAYWTQINSYWIPGTLCNGSPCSTKQVAVVWVNNVDSAPPAPPTDITNLESEYESIAQIIHTFYPNAVIAYFSSIPYTGYSDGIGTTDPEPGAYDAGYGVQQAVLAQINGDANLNFNPSSGPVEAPWMAWGPYLWANGLLPRSDGTTWDCVDYVNDGVHPSQTSGRPKIAAFLLNFLKTDPTATPWFLAP